MRCATHIKHGSQASHTRPYDAKLLLDVANLKAVLNALHNNKMMLQER